VSTKLNRSHVVRGATALIQPSLGRTVRDIQGGAKQQVSVKDSMSMVHLSRGSLHPPSDQVRSEVAIVSQPARTLLGPDTHTGRQRCSLLSGDQSPCAAGSHRREAEFAGVEGHRHQAGAHLVGRVTARRRVRHVTADDAVARPETLVVEEPLEIRVNGTPITVNMRTPGSDIELAQGFLLTEGVIGRRDDVLTVRYCRGATEDGSGFSQNTYNVLDVTLAPGVQMPDVDVTRNFYTTSSCGVCGKASLDAVRLISRHCPGDDPSTVAAETLSAMPEKLRAAQKVFASTGGLHGAALFGADGSTLAVREDIGRHNAVDKVIGWALEADRIPLTSTVLLVSGRASFELTQKAVMAGIPVLAAVSAPSSLAVDLASQSGLTLVAFLRGDSMNVYSRPDRVTPGGMSVTKSRR